MICWKSSTASAEDPELLEEVAANQERTKFLDKSPKKLKQPNVKKSPSKQKRGAATQASIRLHVLKPNGAAVAESNAEIIVSRQPTEV